MKLTTNDLKLFSLLDGEVDKTLSFGCCVRMIEGNAIITLASPLYTVADKKFVSLSTHSGPFDFDIKENECEILGHYPTHADVLRYVGSIKEYTEINIDLDNIRRNKGSYQLDISTHISDETGIVPQEDFSLNLTKPIQNYSEEEKAELITFLESIK